jgi:RimJ/RimL family protein N-acetyltransferase
MIQDVQLRDVIEDDLPIFFQQQLDPDASYMAAFPSRDYDAFTAHWKKLLSDETKIKKTILFKEQVAGNIGSWQQSCKQEIGYWIGKEFWGKGIATEALSKFLLQIKARPLYAYVAKHNYASIRVLEKCGFIIIDEEKNFSNIGEERIEGVILILGARA